MVSNNEHKIGILAFGSLLDNPGQEIKNLERIRINCKTPFNIEFARLSSSRSNAPTLIPIHDNSRGKRTEAKIIVIDSATSIHEAKSILWRRECHNLDNRQVFKERQQPTPNNVLVGELDNFCSVEKVIYTYFLPQEIYNDLTPEKLADFAIESILSMAGSEGKDGIRYLLSAKKYGIETEYSEEYERLILSKSNTHSLSEAIAKLDKERQAIQEVNTKA